MSAGAFSAQALLFSTDLGSTCSQVTEHYRSVWYSIRRRTFLAIPKGDGDQVWNVLAQDTKKSKIVDVHIQFETKKQM